jgi:ribonuclease D
LIEKWEMYSKTISREELEKLEIKAFDGKIILIEDTERLLDIIDELGRCKILGFDTETRPSFKKGRINKVALLQLSCRKKTYLIRLNKTGMPVRLANILSNPSIIKVGVAIRDDIIALNKLRIFKQAGFVDLQDMVKKYGIENFGLKNICGIILGFRISKAQQLSNWEQEILDESQLRYAATDSWVPHEIYNRLIENKKLIIDNRVEQAQRLKGVN